MEKSKEEKDKEKRRFSQAQYDMLLQCSEEEKTKKEKDERGLWCNNWQYKLLKVCATDDEGIERWNEWRKKNDEEIWLEGADLSFCYLKRVLLGWGHPKNPKRHVYYGLGFFRPVYLERAVFDGASLEDANFGLAHLRNASFMDAHLEGTCFSGADLRDAFFVHSTVNGSTLFWNCKVDRKTDFRGVALNSVQIDPGTKQLLEYNIRRMNWEWWYKKGDWWVRFLKSVFIKPFWWMSDYGMSTVRVIGVFFLLALLFAAVYLAWGLIDYHLVGLKDNPGIVSNLFVLEGEQETVSPWLVPFRSVYFSIVTMTTLGFGDIYANAHSFLRGLFGHALLALQVILGYVLLGALITRFAVLFTAGGPAGKFATR